MKFIYFFGVIFFTSAIVFSTKAVTKRDCLTPYLACIDQVLTDYKAGRLNPSQAAQRIGVCNCDKNKCEGKPCPTPSSSESSSPSSSSQPRTPVLQ